jgi:hypothetical protein
MKELKTLKDLNIIKGKVHALGGEVGIDELRKEAIKWLMVKYKVKYTTGVGFHGRIGWLEFMEFHNITEEDLEEKEPKLKITAGAILNENNPEFFSELLKKGVNAVEPEMEKQVKELEEKKE